MYIATCLEQSAIFMVADFCLHWPHYTVKTSLIDAQNVAAQNKNTLLSGTDEGNCVTAPHASEG